MAPLSRPRKLDAEALWNYALKILGQRAHSVSEVRAKLSRRAEHSADVPVVLQRLKEYGMADDGKFSDLFASARLQNQGFGKFRVLRELQSKRVPSATAERAVAKAFAGVDENQLAGEFLARKYRGKNLREFLAEEKNLAAAYRRLRTAGFNSSTAMSVLKRFRTDLDEAWTDPEEPDL